MICVCISSVMVLMDYLLCWFVVVHGGFHGGVDTGFFVVVLVVVFGGDARGGWC